MAALFDLLLARPPLARRAQRLSLGHQKQKHLAWIDMVESSDLSALEPESFLSQSELALAASFRFLRRKNTFLLGRLAAKLALSPLLAETDRTRIELTNGVFGQPLVSHPQQHGAEISLSHSERRAVALAFPREQFLAVDLETVDRDQAETVRKELKFLPGERRWIESAAVEEPAAYVMLWTVREALGKLLRCGLSCPMEVLGADQIKPMADGGWESAYENFRRYRCLSWIRENQVLSIALSTDTELACDDNRPDFTASSTDGGRQSVP